MLRNKKVRRVLVIAVFLIAVIAIIAIKPSMADVADYEFTATGGGQVELDGENDGTVIVDFKVPEAGRYYMIQGDLSPHETDVNGENTNAEHPYFTLVSNDIIQMPDSCNVYQNDWVIPETSCIRFFYEDLNDDGSTGLDLSAGATMWRATYTIDSATPSGTYYVALSKATLTYLGTDSNDYEWDASTDNTVLVATIKVTRAKVHVSPTISGYEASYPYTGSQITPEVTVTSSTNPGLILEKDKDYTVSYGTNKEVGENAGSITISPVESSDYNVEETTVNFEITKATSDISVLYAKITSVLPNGIRVPAGTQLGEIENLIKMQLPEAQKPFFTLAGLGVTWNDSNQRIVVGNNVCLITYLQNGDSAHYTEVTNQVVPIYGLGLENIEISVEGGNGTFSIPSASVTNQTETILSNQLEDSEITIELNPAEDYIVDKVTVDDEEQTVTDNKVTFKVSDSDMIVTIKFKYALLPLEITGIDDNQEIAYTGQPVELVGNLAVSENTDNINVTDLRTKWYDSKNSEIDQPSEIGTYKVVYSYKGENYEGSLTINFKIVKADSDFDALLIQLSSYGEIKIPVGTELSAVEGIIQQQYPAFKMAFFGLSWVDDTIKVKPGLTGEYPVVYTQGNDSTHYNPVTRNIPIYGLNMVTINTSVEGGHGTISEIEEPVLEGTEVTITVTPEDGYKIGKVTVDGEKVEVTNNQIVVTARNTSPMEIVAGFELIPITYEYLEGKELIYTLKSNDTATFRINAEYSLLDKVYVDDELVASKNYTSKSGSTVITFTKEFMESLSVGNHTLKVTFTDTGTAAITFTVKAAETVKPTDNTVGDVTPANTTVDNSVATKPTTTTPNIPKTGDKILVDIYIAVVSGLGLFMIIDHKLNSKPRKSTRRK